MILLYYDIKNKIKHNSHKINNYKKFTNKNINIFKTVNVKDWTLSMPKLPVMNGVTSKHKVPNYLEINPAYPFIYVRS